MPHLEFAPLQQRGRAAAEGRDARTIAARRATTASRMQLERALTRDEGLPQRPWYRHHVYAPGLYTGYGVKTFPAVREAIELRKWDEANAQIVVLAKVIEGYAKLLE